MNSDRLQSKLSQSETMTNEQDQQSGIAVPARFAATKPAIDRNVRERETLASGHKSTIWCHGWRLITRNRFGLLLKIGLSIGLVLLLLGRLERVALVETLRSANFGWLALALVTTLIGKLISAYRWRTLLEIHEIKLPLRKLISSLFAGSLLNSVTPSTIGGDLYRAYDTADASEKRYVTSFVTIFFDRWLGIVALATIALLALLPARSLGAPVEHLATLVVVIFTLVIASALVLFNRRLATRLTLAFRKMGLSVIGKRVVWANKTFRQVREAWKGIVIAAGLAALLQINVVFQYFFISESLSLEVPLIYLLLVVPVALLIIALPISINGIGLRENVFAYLLAGAGVSLAGAAALSLIVLAMLLLHSLVGAFILSFRGITTKERFMALWT